MAGIYDYPGAHPVDRVLAVAHSLGFLAFATEMMEKCQETVVPGREDYEGLAILLRTCAMTLDEVAKQQEQ